MNHTCTADEPALAADCEACLAEYLLDVIEDRREHQDREEGRR